MNGGLKQRPKDMISKINEPKDSVELLFNNYFGSRDIFLCYNEVLSL